MIGIHPVNYVEPKVDSFKRLSRRNVVNYHVAVVDQRIRRADTVGPKSSRHAQQDAVLGDVLGDVVGLLVAVVFEAVCTSISAVSTVKKAMESWFDSAAPGANMFVSSL